MKILGFDLSLKRAGIVMPPEFKVDDAATWAVIGGNNASTSGVTVTPDTSLTFSAVWSAVRLLADTIGSLPFDIIDKQGDYRRVVSDHRLYRLIHSEPNELMTSQTLRSVMMLHLNLWGNSYLRIIRNGDADVTALIPIPPDDVEMILKGGKLYYKIKGDKTPIDASDILHIKGISFDGILGMSPIEYARESIGSGIAANRETGKLFSSGAKVQGVLEAPGMLTEEQLREVKRSFKRNSSDGIAILFGGMKYAQTAINPVDAQWLEQRRLTVEDVARIFRVPPHAIYDLSRSTNNNIEHQAIEFVQYSLVPWIKAIEQEFDRKIFRTGENERYGVKLDVNGLLRGDVASRSDYYQKMKLSGNLTTNEVRYLENFPPVEGGDRMLYPVNLTTMERLTSEHNTTENNNDEGNQDI